MEKIIRPDREELLMATAMIWAKRGTCSRLQVGAVLARDGRIISIGYNGAPRGVPHCIHTDDTSCTNATHAEANAISFAALNGISTHSSELYTTHSPCMSCAHLLINAGIKCCYYHIEFRDISGIDFLRNAGVETKWLPSVNF